MSEVIKVENLTKYFPVEQTLIEKLRRQNVFVKAVDGINFSVNTSEILALVGESGCGKTTTGRLVIRLIEPTKGKIFFNNNDITFIKGGKIRELRKDLQIIFQDPYASLNPRMKIGDIIAEPLIEHGLSKWSEAKQTTMSMLKRVGLIPPEVFYVKYPHQLSGGQRQRVAIARAMILKPKFVVADEPVSMIDVSLRISILELLISFKKEYKTSLLLITHDLGIASIIAERTAVMYLGKIMEIGPTKEIISKPAHPYTIGLLSSIPSLRKRIKKLTITGEIADPKNPPSGCRFHPRCPFATGKCKKEEPPLIKVNENHFSACHYSLEIMQQYSP
ncbi:MAG: ABC transporter ATP-binding protein [Thermoprotei archaeon]